MGKIATEWSTLRPSIIRELQQQYEDRRFKPFTTEEAKEYTAGVERWRGLQHTAPLDDDDRRALAEARELVQESVLAMDGRHTLKSCEAMARASGGPTYRSEVLARLRHLAEFVPFHDDLQPLIRSLEGSTT